MAKYRRIDVVLKMEEIGMIPVFYHPNIELCKEVLAACYKGGARVFEFTNRDDFAYDVFAQLNKFAIQYFPDLILGIGTVLDAGTTAMYLQAGANFVVSPILNPEMAHICNRKKVLWIGGCETLSEISQAEMLGAEIVKVFPGEMFRPSFIKALKAPMPWTSVMVTGGVSPTKESINEWFEAGVTCVGIGSQLFPKEALAKHDFPLIEYKVSQAIQLIKDWKAKNTSV